MTENDLQNLDEFRKNTVGKSYSVKTAKILFHSKSESTLKKQTDVPDDREFFCSELVAKAFKVIGIFSENSNEKSCGSFLPGSFEENGIIDQELKEEVFLGPTYLINTVLDSFL